MVHSPCVNGNALMVRRSLPVSTHHQTVRRGDADIRLACISARARARNLVLLNDRNLGWTRAGLERNYKPCTATQPVLNAHIAAVQESDAADKAVAMDHYESVSLQREFKLSRYLWFYGLILAESPGETPPPEWVACPIGRGGRLCLGALNSARGLIAMGACAGEPADECAQLSSTGSYVVATGRDPILRRH